MITILATLNSKPYLGNGVLTLEYNFAGSLYKTLNAHNSKRKTLRHVANLAGKYGRPAK